MALNLTNLMTALGENIKKIDIFNTLITSLETYKDDIYTDLAAGGFQDQYSPYPAQFLSMKNSVASWISTLKSNCTNILLDTELVLDELPIYSFDITSVLNGLYDYMEDNSQTIETSVVTLGGADVNTAAVASADDALAYSYATGSVIADGNMPPVLFCTRILDGTSSPGNGVTAHTRYNNQESQLAKTATVYAELISNTTIGAETARIYSELPASGSYLATTESPGPGPTLTNPEASNIISTNAKFNVWVGDSPTGWSMSGTITTDYEDASGTGAGPLQINTAGVTASRQLTGLSHNKMYFVGARVENGTLGDLDPDIAILRLKTLSGTLIGSSATISIESDHYGYVYTFATLTPNINLDDVYVEFEYDTKGHATNLMKVHKIVVAPVTYYNGLGWVWWPGYHLSSDTSQVAVGELATMAISNNNNGKFQTFFRKAYNVQLPTADAPTVNDALAGG